MILVFFLWMVTVALLFRSRWKAKKIETEKQLVLECLEEGILSLDSEKKVQQVNYKASKLFNLSKRFLVGKRISSFEDNPLLEKGAALLEECMKRESILTDALSLEKNDYDLIAVPRDKKEGAILILQDKSAHAQVVKIGKDFIANASHELRTPITIIRGFAETLQDMPELPKEMVSEIMQKIVRSCERMDLLVKNLLTLTDLENLPALRFQNVDLVALLENCRHLLLAAHPSAQVSLEKERTPLMIRVDPDILELALMNLLENAVKYSPEPAQISIKIEEESERVNLIISDKGIGIPGENLETIFRRFYTVDKARSRRLGGAGLGLSIVKTIIEKHEGEISVTSELGRGSSFTLRLPNLA